VFGFLHCYNLLLRILYPTPEKVDELNRFGVTDPRAGEEEEEVYDARAIARAESAEIMSRKFAERDQMKTRMIKQQKFQRRRKEQKRQKNVTDWQKKMKRSPFMVNLVAENERIDEENRVRLREESRRERLLAQQKAKVKNEIVLKALAESSDLEALRREKRAIQMEEKRLKALLDLEKTNAHRKQDLLAAQRAERQRKQAVKDHHRKARLDEMADKESMHAMLLREKLDISEQQYPGTFTSFGN